MLEEIYPSDSLNIGKLNPLYSLHFTTNVFFRRYGEDNAKHFALETFWIVISLI